MLRTPIIKFSRYLQSFRYFESLMVQKYKGGPRGTIRREYLKSAETVRLIASEFKTFNPDLSIIWAFMGLTNFLKITIPSGDSFIKLIKYL